MYIPTTVLTQGSGSSLISTLTLGVAGPVNFANIPASYTHLLLLGYLRQDAAITEGTVRLRFNQDSGNNYQEELNSYLNATASAAGQVAQGQIQIGHSPGGSAPASYFGVLSIYIPFYGGTSNFKPALGDSYSALSSAATGQRRTWAGGHWLSTAAINHVNIFGASGAGDFATGTVVSLYGLT